MFDPCELKFEGQESGIVQSARKHNDTAILALGLCQIEKKRKNWEVDQDSVR